MQDYRAVLYDWNDTLNRNLAAAETEVGSGLRHQLEGRIYERFAALGRKLEGRYRELDQNAQRTPWEQRNTGVSRELLRLREHGYALNVAMLRQIRDGRVGRKAPT